MRLERKVEKLCKFLQINDPSKLEATALSDDGSIERNARDSMMRQSMNASNLTDIRRASLFNIVEQDTNSVIARRASNSIENEYNLLDKENIQMNQNFTTENLGRNRLKLSGFSTLDNNSKPSKVLHEFNQNAPFTQGTSTNYPQPK